jgi:hypothetical protein
MDGPVKTLVGSKGILDDASLQQKLEKKIYSRLVFTPYPILLKR